MACPIPYGGHNDSDDDADDLPQIKLDVHDYFSLYNSGAVRTRAAVEASRPLLGLLSQRHLCIRASLYMPITSSSPI